VSIPFEVYAFSDQYTHAKNYYDNDMKLNYKDGDLILRPVSLLNVLSSRMNSADLSFACSALLSKIYDSGFYDGFRLGGTPLNETIIAAMDIIPKFQKRWKLQVVNATFLTDGEGHALKVIYNSTEGRKHASNLVLRDPVTSASMKSPTNQIDNSKAFLFLLKQRTGCNVVGFRILSTRNAKDYLFNTYKGGNIQPLVDEFRKNKSTVVKSAGFDEYYLLRSEKMTTDEDDEMEVKSTTTRGFVSAFKNYTKGHIQNRVILNRFIGIIS
jgi:hypothetical protein